MTSKPLPASDARNAALRGVLLYVLVGVLSLFGAVAAMNLWRADLRAPFDYEGDAILNVTLVKNIVEKGWYVETEALGAPAGMELYDFPVGDNLVCTVIKGMSLFTSDPFLLTNLFFLATFPMVAMSAFFTTRRFGISTGPAVLAGFLYAMLPYHFFRGTAHLYFTAYFLVPPAILIVWWISSGQLFARRWRRWFAVGVSLLLGCNMVYFPFFSCFLLLVAGILALRRRDRPHVLAAGILIATITGTVLLNLLPNLLYTHAHGAAPSGKRYSFEAELGGLKVAQLLLPVSGHRLPALAALKENYNRTHPLVSENDWVSLGFIGGAGFLALVGCALLLRRRPLRVGEPGEADFSRLIENLGILNAAALLLATIGGFSVLFAVLVTPQIRAYNRISTFIAYFSLLTVAVGLEWAYRRWARSTPAKVAFGAALVALGVLGFLDQTGLNARHDWVGLRTKFRNDKEFFGRVQNSLPAGAMIFELPYEPFPEYGLAIHQMQEYALCRPYLHTKGLRWSYGVIKGRPGDTWEKDTAAKPPEQMLPVLHRAGFSGVYIDRAGYADQGLALEGKLRDLLGAEPLSDHLGRFSLFKLPPPEGKPPALASLLPLPPPTWSGGFYDLETAPDGTSWRWCAADGEVNFFNDSGAARRLRLSALIRSSHPEPAHLQIRGNALNEDLTTDPAGVAFSRVVTLPPGSSKIRFHSDSAPLPVKSADPRRLVWRVDNFKMENVD